MKNNFPLTLFRWVAISEGISYLALLSNMLFIKPSDAVVNAVALLAFGCLGLSSVDKFTKAKKDIVDAVKEEEKQNN